MSILWYIVTLCVYSFCVAWSCAPAHRRKCIFDSITENEIFFRSLVFKGGMTSFFCESAHFAEGDVDSLTILFRNVQKRVTSIQLKQHKNLHEFSVNLKDLFKSIGYIEKSEKRNVRIRCKRLSQIQVNKSRNKKKKIVWKKSSALNFEKTQQ